MKLTRLETLRFEDVPNLLYVQLHTDEGPVGLGETFFGAQAVEAYLHETAAPALLGTDPLAIGARSRSLVPYVGYQGSGAEVRGASAVDIALWDLLGQATGQPIYQLLGGACRSAVPVYNTCAGSDYIRRRPTQSVSNWGLDNVSGPYEDLAGFLDDAGALAHSLVEQGYVGMKIWPFDAYAERSGGTWIDTADLDRGLEPFRRIRDAVGSRIEIMVELHSLWDLPAASRIIHALEEFEPYWFEDPIRNDSLDALASLATTTSVPIAIGESLAGRRAFRDALERGAASIAITDIGWVGGISEARQVAGLAEAFEVPIAPHDCTGPVVLTAGTHLSLSAPNAVLQEMVRAYYHGWYRDLVTELPTVENGTIRPPDGPGLGTRLQPDLAQRPGTHVRRSESS